MVLGSDRMKHYLPLAPSAFTIAENPYSDEIIERLVALNGQHRALAEKLRELHGLTSQPTGVHFKWHDLKNQVANLRSELECFKEFF